MINYPTGGKQAIINKILKEKNTTEAQKKRLHRLRRDKKAEAKAKPPHLHLFHHGDTETQSHPRIPSFLTKKTTGRKEKQRSFINY